MNLKPTILTMILTTMILASGAINGATREYLLPTFIRIPLFTLGIVGLFWMPLYTQRYVLRLTNKEEE